MFQNNNNKQVGMKIKSHRVCKRHRTTIITKNTMECGKSSNYNYHLKSIGHGQQGNNKSHRRLNASTSSSKRSTLE